VNINSPKIDALVTLVAVLAIVAVETVALLHGINGVALTSSVGGIGVIVGWWAKRAKDSKGGPDGAA
jgi:hypothetical protein